MTLGHFTNWKSTILINELNLKQKKNIMKVGQHSA